MSNFIDNFAADMKYNTSGKRMWCLKVVVILITFHLPLFTHHFSLFTSAHAQTLREAFAAMPDSLLPTLTKNNRLDMMDFMDAKMKAAVTNSLGGETLMTFLNDDSLSVRMSASLTVEMRLQKADTTAVIGLKRTYATAAGEHQSVLSRYDARTWQELSPATVIESTLPKFDEKIKSDTQ